MPADPTERLDWNEENLSQVVSELYRAVETDQALHSQLLADPFTVVSARINVPESYRGGMFAREKKKQVMMFYVPIFGATKEALPEGTTELDEKGDFEPICSANTVW